MGRYDRNRDDEGRFTGGSRGDPRWRDDDFGRRNYGRGQQPPRDDRGRFMSEGETGDYYGNGRNENRDYGDWRHGGSRGYEGGRNYGYEEDSRYRGDDYGREGHGRDDYGRDEYRGGERERDEFGRFTSEDDDGGRRGGFSRGGDRDYDDEYGNRGASRGRNSGQGRGWFGDPMGHAEAARERWQESRGSRYDDDDDRGGRGNRSGRGSQDRGDDDHRGWFGDPRGHAQAARMGWRHRQR